MPREVMSGQAALSADELGGLNTIAERNGVHGNRCSALHRA
jgi:hypothetical protein